MFDAWVAECLPCRWQELHKTEDGAIGAAEEHVFSRHRKVDSAERGRLKMGHVMSRTITEQSDIEPAPPDVPEQNPAAQPGDRGEQPAGPESAVQQIQRATDDFLASLKSEGQ
jgi:hypothetical protein